MSIDILSGVHSVVTKIEAHFKEKQEICPYQSFVTHLSFLVHDLKQRSHNSHYYHAVY